MPKAHAWAAVPLGLYALAGAIVVVGSLAGVLALPALLWTSPVVAGLLIVGGYRTTHTPILTASRDGTEGFPDALESRVISTMAALGQGGGGGTARRMVADISTLSRAILVELPETDEAGDLRGHIVELVASATDVAQDLGSLDQALSLLDSHRDRFASQPAKWLDALSQCERARDRHVQQLLDVLSILARVKAQESTGHEDSSAELAELTRTLERDMEVRIEAEAEIEELLALEPLRG